MDEQKSYFQHAKILMSLGVPLIGSNLAQIAITTTDTLMLGWYSVEALAATTIAGMMIFVIFIVGSGFAFAVMPMVASAAAAGDAQQVRRVTRMGLWISLLYFIVFIPVLMWPEPILLALGQTPEVANTAQVYMRIASWSMAANLIVMVLKSYLAALERTQVILWGTIAAAVLNGFVNYALIFGNWGFPALGVRGAAIASVMSVGILLIALLVYAVRVMPEHTLFHRIWRPDGEVFWQVFRLGWPIGVTNLAETGLFAASSVMMGWLGTLPLAAHGIALQLASMTFMTQVGIASAATVRAGRALGRGDEDSLRKGGIVAMILSAGFGVLTVALFLLLPEQLIALFLDGADPRRDEIILIGTGLLVMAALFQFADGAQVVALGLLRGVQDTRVPMIIAAITYWLIGITASYVLGFKLGLAGRGIWLGLAIGLALAAVAMMYRFWTRSVKIGGDKARARQGGYPPR